MICEVGVGNERILELLGRALDSEEYSHLIKSSRFSELQIARIADVIAASPAYAGLTSRDWGYAVIGSLGRMEAESSESDADLILLCDSQEAAGSSDAANIDLEIRETIRRTLNIKVSNGLKMTSPCSVETVAGAEFIGGDNDTVNHLTKRILLLIEGRAVIGKDRVETVRHGIFAAFDDAAETRGKHFHSLCNDVARYYRTVCVDYKSRVDHERKPWGIRNVKLRHRSKYLFFSTMLAIIASVKQVGEETGRGSLTADVYEQLSFTPTERLITALDRGGLLKEHVDIVSHFNYFVGRMSIGSVRSELESVDYYKRDENPAFKDLHANSRRLDDAMLRIVNDLPKEWRERLFKAFLL